MFVFCFNPGCITYKLFYLIHLLITLKYASCIWFRHNKVWKRFVVVVSLYLLLVIFWAVHLFSCKNVIFLSNILRMPKINLLISRQRKSFIRIFSPSSLIFMNFRSANWQRSRESCKIVFAFVVIQIEFPP